MQRLKLGDIIWIVDTTNDILHFHTFFISYIDSSKMILIDISDYRTVQLPISPDGTIGDGTVSEIKILSRNPENGYARQNGLLPGTWVNIYFRGDVPFILVGEITNLEEDMIEIKTLDNEILYINFDYHGIPLELPIETL
jgi:hypothetical protein